MIMNDWYLDPPEEPEIPECCDLEMAVDDDGNCECMICEATIEAHPDIEPPDDDDWKCGGKYPCECQLPPEESTHCQHGNKHGDCGACDHLGDLAFDTMRENRL